MDIYVMVPNVHGLGGVLLSLMYLFIIMEYKFAKNGCTFELFAPRVSMTTIDAYTREEQKKNVLRIIRHIYENKSRQTTSSAEHSQHKIDEITFNWKPSLNHASPFEDPASGEVHEMNRHRRFWFHTYKYDWQVLCGGSHFCFDAIPIKRNHFHPSLRSHLNALCVWFKFFLLRKTWNKGSRKLFVYRTHATVVGRANDGLPFLINHVPTHSHHRQPTVNDATID